MEITIYGKHTEPCGHNYEKSDEFLRLMKLNWSAVKDIRFNDPHAAEILLDIREIWNWTTKEIYTRLNDTMLDAADRIDWDIWEGLV